MQLKPYNELSIEAAYYRGWQWWLNANESFKTLIGAIEYVPDGIDYLCDCTEEDESGNVIGTWIEEVDDPVDCMYNGYIDCETSEIASFAPVELESDGIVLAKSAMAYPGANAGPDNAMPGSNHSQMRNDSNLETKLDELLDGFHGMYFRTL